MKKALCSCLFILMILLLSSNLYAAACIGTSPNLTAASASYEDVSACVAISTYGDTIRIPSGNATWINGIVINKDVRIVGNGIDSSILTSGFANNGAVDAFFKFQPDQTTRSRLSSLSGEGTFEVSGITFASSSRLSYKYGVWIYNTNLPAIVRIKIHDNKYVNIHRATDVTGYVHGVFYNNVLFNTNGSYPQGAGRGSLENDRMALGSGAGWYVEDNKFSFSGIDALVCGAGNSGGGFVVRYNNVTGSLSGASTYVETHGNQTSYVYGPQITEVYGNSFLATGVSRVTNVRGGKNIYLNNVAANGWISIWEEFSDSLSSSTGPTGKCPEVAGMRQTCLDTCTCQKVHDSYFINNRPTVNGTIIKASVLFDYKDRGNNILNSPPEVVENIEYFNFVTTNFNGTVGAGCGAPSNRPSTCNVGVGYWATYQSCTDLTGMVGANPSRPIEGTLFKCSAPNTWTACYTPYTYPHPLRADSGSTTFSTGPTSSTGGSGTSTDSSSTTSTSGTSSTPTTSGTTTTGTTTDSGSTTSTSSGTSSTSSITTSTTSTTSSGTSSTTSTDTSSTTTTKPTKSKRRW